MPISSMSLGYSVRTSDSSTLWYSMATSSPKRRASSSRTIAVISSGDQEGPQPPEKQLAEAGISKMSTLIGEDMLAPRL